GPNLGQIGIALSGSTPNLSANVGSLVLITFHLKAGAAGQTPINVAATNAPSGAITVATRLDALSGQILLQPAPTNASNDPLVDGFVSLQALHFSIDSAGSAAAGAPLTLTVTAQDQFYNTAPNYAGTVHFASSDKRAVLPVDMMLSAGTGVFSVTLNTAGN